MASNHKHSTISYALGFIQDHIDNTTEPLTCHEADADDEKYARHIEEENEHREQLRVMMTTLSEGVTQLMRENLTLSNKIFLGKSALS